MTNPAPAQASVATWHPLDENGSAELRVNGKRITSFPSYPAAEEAAQRINAALSPPPTVGADTESCGDRSRSAQHAGDAPVRDQAEVGQLGESAASHPDHRSTYPTVGTEDEARAWIIHDREDEYYGKGADTIRFCPLLPEEEEAGLTATALYAARPSPSAVEIKIKPLVWGPKTGGCTATGAGINYAMGEEEPGLFCLFHPFHSEPMPKEQVQALAQADYEQRIRSCIASEKGE